MAHRFLIISLSILLIKCSAIPQRKFTGTAITRKIITDLQPLDSSAENRPLSIGATLGNNIGYKDSGKLTGGYNISGFGEVTIQKVLTVGVQPYFARINQTVDSPVHMGIQPYLRLRIFRIGKARFHFTVLGNFAGNKSSEEDCIRGESESFSFFGNPCTEAGEQTKAKSEVHINEWGIAHIFEYFLNNYQSVYLIPSVYKTRINAENTLIGQSTNDFTTKTTHWNQSIAIGYTYRFKGIPHTYYQLEIGASNAKEFINNKRTRKIRPLAHLTAGFSL